MNSSTFKISPVETLESDPLPTLTTEFLSLFLGVESARNVSAETLDGGVIGIIEKSIVNELFESLISISTSESSFRMFFSLFSTTNFISFFLLIVVISSICSAFLTLVGVYPKEKHEQHDYYCFLSFFFEIGLF